VRRTLLAVAAFLALSGVLHAQAPAGAYPGVRPGSSNPPPLDGVARARAAHGERLVTWPGFQMLADGRSQFFLQTSGPIRITERRGDDRFSLLLTNTSTHLRNTRRPLETRFFNTPVTRATVKRHGRKDLSVVFELRAPATPTVTSEARDDGYHYVLVTFAPGTYVENPAPAPVSTGTINLVPSAEPTPAPVAPARAPRSQARDDERPPAMR
jgi:hypothetical protein